MIIMGCFASELSALAENGAFKISLLGCRSASYVFAKLTGSNFSFGQSECYEQCIGDCSAAGKILLVIARHLDCR